MVGLDHVLWGRTDRPKVQGVASRLCLGRSDHKVFQALPRLAFLSEWKGLDAEMNLADAAFQAARVVAGYPN